MKQIDPVAIDVFVAQMFEDPKVQSIVGEWRIEPSILQDSMVRVFKEMGLYFATPSHRAILLHCILRTLKSSPEIRQLVKRAEMEEKARRRSRHADA